MDAGRVTVSAALAVPVPCSLRSMNLFRFQLYEDGSGMNNRLSANSIQGLFAAVVLSSTGRSAAAPLPRLTVPLHDVVAVLTARYPTSTTSTSPSEITVLVGDVDTGNLRLVRVVRTNSVGSAASSSVPRSVAPAPLNARTFI